jgi:hypothetical protein
MAPALRYAYCFCIRCNGSLRTRRIVAAHRCRARRRLAPNDRICHCSKHPLGARVHRNTFRSHVKRDKLHRITVNIDQETLAEVLDEDGNDDIPLRTHIDGVQQLIDACNLADGLVDDTDGEAEDEAEVESAGEVDDEESEDSDIEELLEGLGDNYGWEETLSNGWFKFQVAIIANCAETISPSGWTGFS